MAITKKKEVEAEQALKLIKLSDLGDIQFVSSGIKEIDELTGGFPRGRVTEIHGVPAVGKTSLLLQTLAGMSQTAKVLLVDAENALNPARLKQYGASIDNIDITAEASLEKVAEFTTDNVKKYDVIVIDSIATLVPQAESDGQVGDANIGLRARRMGAWMRRLTPKLGKSECAFVFINQLRDSMNPYGAPTFTPGGHAVPYAASLRLKLTTTSKDKHDKGHYVNVTVVKSKIGKPHITTRFLLEH